MSLAERLTSLVQVIAQDIKSLGNRLNAVESKSEVFIDELPEGDYPAIAFVKIPGTNEYVMKVRAGENAVV